MKATWVSRQGSLTAFPTNDVGTKSTLQSKVSWKPEVLSRGRVLGEGLTAPTYQLGAWLNAVSSPVGSGLNPCHQELWSILGSPCESPAVLLCKTVCSA